MAEEISKVFDSPEGCDLEVRNVQGKISIKGWDQPRTQVIARPHQDGVEIEIYQEGRKVVARTVDAHWPAGILNWLSRGHIPTVDYTVHVPHASNLQLHNVSGPVQVSQVRGTVDTHNVDGPTTLDDLSGQIKAETVNGPVQASQLAGRAKLKAVNGRLAVTDGALQELTAEAVNGRIDIATSVDPNGRYGFNTVNGGCTLTVPSNTPAHISVQGINMGVECDLETRDVQRSFGRWSGTIGDRGGPMAKITFHTVNGGLHITAERASEQPTASVPRAEAAPTPQPEAPEAAEPDETIEAKVAQTDKGQEPSERPSRSEILERVERGEITVQEAIELLEG